MSSNTTSLLLKIGGTALASMGLYLLYKVSQERATCMDENVYSKQQLLLLLEDLRIDYTPYYIHYYHLLTALHNDYSDKPKYIESLTEKIKQKLQDKLNEVNQEIIQRYMLESESTLHKWIKHYIEEPEVKKQIQIIDQNEEKLFERLEQPNFELDFPLSLTKEVFLKILKKTFAAIRYQIYKEIRQIIRTNQMRDILGNLNMQDIRARVFIMYGLPEPTPRHPSHRILQKAHYTYMIDKDFMQRIKEAKQSHERFMTAILSSDCFPQVERNDPLETQEEDEIPPKFGPKWFEEEKNQEKDNFKDLQEDETLNNSEQKFEKIMQQDSEQVDQLEQHIDQQKNLLFQVTRMKAKNVEDDEQPLV